MTRRIVSHVQQQFSLLFSLVALLWLIEIANFLVGHRLNAFGIHPRTIIGLLGILVAPFLHGGFGHLLANTGPLLVLGWLILLRGADYFWQVTIFCALASGIGVWLFGASHSTTVGASGVIFGYLGFLLLRGFYEGSATSISISMLVGFLYGGVVFGIFPMKQGVSWEAHLFGFLGGIISARSFSASRAVARRSV